MRYLIAMIALLVGCATAPEIEHDFVVRLSNPGVNRCSAVAISDSELYTAAHCLRDDKSPIVHYRGNEYIAHVVYNNEETDLAVLVLEQSVFRTWAKTHMDSLHSGDGLVQIGYGCKRLVRDAVFVGSNVYDQSIADVETCPGDSGGALLTVEGDLVGIVLSQKGGTRSFSARPMLRFSMWP